MRYDQPTRLYDSSDLLEGYQRDDPMAFANCWDFRTYRTYVADGGATPKTLDIRLAQAEHDARISAALKAVLDQDPTPKLVGCWFPRGTEPVFPPRSEPPLSMVF